MFKLAQGLRPELPRICLNFHKIGLRYASNKSSLKASPEKDHKSSNSPKQLKENIWTIPNVLTMTRLMAAPAIGFLVVQNSYPTALGLMIYASVTDFVDGYLARKYHTYTTFGSIADPAADKALMVILAGCLTYSGIIPSWCGAAILGRDAGLAIAASVIRYRTLPAPKTAKRYFDLSLPTFNVRPTKISKWNTFFQMIYLSVCLGDQVFPIVGPEVLQGMAAVVTGTTLWSGISYMFEKNAIQPLTPKQGGSGNK